MEIVLLERIEKLGQMGDVVKVKNGHARNFLLPQGKALRATAENLKRFEDQRSDLEARSLERRSEAEAVAGKMSDAKIVLVRQAGETGQLYGSVSARDISEGLDEVGYKLERRQIVLTRPIKELGIHSVQVNLHPEVSVDVSVNVARSEAEAERQAVTGRAAVGNMEDEFEDDFDDRGYDAGETGEDGETPTEAAADAGESETADGGESEAADAPESETAESGESEAESGEKDA